MDKKGLNETVKMIEEWGVGYLINEAGSETQIPVSAGDKNLTLMGLREKIGNCQRCKLWEGRTHIVFGVGNPDADIMFIGEAPGRDEDIKGEPFVGRAGQLLTDIIEKGIGIKRSDVYIANIVKCRPPENRNPERDEIKACSGFLFSQIEIIKPKVIVALGTFAAQTLLETKQPISSLRGNFASFRGIALMPTFHPSYLLRQGQDKKLKAIVWEDIKKVMNYIGIPVIKRQR